MVQTGRLYHEQIFGGKPDGKNHLEDIDIDGEDNTKIELQEVEWGRGLD
jgi:hypothetical protein